MIALCTYYNIIHRRKTISLHHSANVICTCVSILIKRLPQCARLLHTEVNGLSLVIVWCNVLDIINDIINEVCLANQRLRGRVLEVCEVNMEVVVGRLVVQVDSKFIAMNTILLIDGLL